MLLVLWSNILLTICSGYSRAWCLLGELTHRQRSNNTLHDEAASWSKLLFQSVLQQFKNYPLLLSRVLKNLSEIFEKIPERAGVYTEYTSLLQVMGAAIFSEAVWKLETLCERLLGTTGQDLRPFFVCIVLDKTLSIKWQIKRIPPSRFIFLVVRHVLRPTCTVAMMYNLYWKLSNNLLSTLKYICLDSHIWNTLKVCL